MRQLRYAGPGEDAAHVIVETVDGLDKYTLVLDDGLRAAARQELPRLDRPDTESVALSPRDIQTKVRGGASAEAVAEEADLPLDKVMRFAFPVLQERARVADEARRARARRTTPQGDMGVFGEIVDGKLAAHEIDPAEVAWDAFRRLDGQWTVTAGWRQDDADRFAQWSFGLSTRVISPLDDTASDLLSDRPLTRPAEDVEDVATVGGPYEEQVLADPVHPTGPIPPTLRLAGAPEPAAPASAQRHPSAGGDPFAGPEWPADPAPRGLGSFFSHQQAAPVVAAAPPVPEPEPVSDEPLLPFTFEAPEPNAPAGRRFRATTEDESPEGKAARARIPSWDDILLGVRRRTD